MVNPLDEAASGIVPTSRIVSKFRASPVCGAAIGLTIPDTVPAIVSSPVVVVVPWMGGALCADAGMEHRSANTAASKTGMRSEEPVVVSIRRGRFIALMAWQVKGWRDKTLRKG